MNGKAAGRGSLLSGPRAASPHARRIGLLLACSLFALGCTTGATTTPTVRADVGDDTTQPVDAVRPNPDVAIPEDAASSQPDSAPEPDAPVVDVTVPEGPIAVAGGQATLRANFTANVSGTLTGRIGAVSMTNNAGTVELDGVALPAFGYVRQAWDGFGLTLVQTLIVKNDALYPAWLYCSGTKFDGVYYEGTDGSAMTWEPAMDGTCEITDAATNRAVDVPSFEMTAPTPDHDFRVTGGPLVVEPGRSGTYTHDGTTWQAHPFEVVNCTTDCGTPGWWELHTILWDGASACFVIYYFFEGGRASQVAYSVCLPGFEARIPEQTIGGTWSR